MMEWESRNCRIILSKVNLPNAGCQHEIAGVAGACGMFVQAISEDQPRASPGALLPSPLDANFGMRLSTLGVTQFHFVQRNRRYILGVIEGESQFDVVKMPAIYKFDG